MAHRVAPQAAAELDDIWYYTAKESGSLEIADKSLIRSLNAFSCLPAIRILVAAATKICVQVCVVLQ